MRSQATFLCAAIISCLLKSLQGFKSIENGLLKPCKGFKSIEWALSCKDFKSIDQQRFYEMTPLLFKSNILKKSKKGRAVCAFWRRID